MSVRAKFQCTRKESLVDDTGGLVQLHPVVASANNEENDCFFKATPAGVITLSILNIDAYNQFEVGKQYYVDFALAN